MKKVDRPEAYLKSKTPRMSKTKIGFEYNVVNVDALIEVVERLHDKVDEDRKEQSININKAL